MLSWYLRLWRLPNLRPALIAWAVLATVATVWFTIEYLYPLIQALWGQYITDPWQRRKEAKKRSDDAFNT